MSKSLNNSAPSQRPPVVNRVLYGFVVAIVLWYAHLLPIVLMGFWRNLLIPSSTMFTNFIHVYIVIAAWLISSSNRATWITALVVTILLFVVQVFLGALPTLEMIPRFGMLNYVQNWLMVLLPVVVAPLAASFLLVKADTIAPKVFRQWNGA